MVGEWRGGGQEVRTQRVVVEERVETGAVNEDILRVQDAQSPRQVTIIRLSGAEDGEVWIVSS